MKILALERELPGVSADGFKLHLRAEAIKIWGLYRQSVIRELYFNPETHTALLVLECQDLDEANKRSPSCRWCRLV